MKNPFAKVFTPNYEDNILKTLEENLYAARKGHMIAVEALQRADATLTYSTKRVETLRAALSSHKAAQNEKFDHLIPRSTTKLANTTLQQS
jgi:hypothetical protein